MPGGFHYKRISSGLFTVPTPVPPAPAVGNLIACRNTGEFYLYDPVADTWGTLGDYGAFGATTLCNRKGQAAELYAADSATIKKSSNGGLTWTDITATIGGTGQGTAVAADDFGAVYAFYAQLGQLYKTTDGTSWSLIATFGGGGAFDRFSGFNIIGVTTSRIMIGAEVDGKVYYCNLDGSAPGSVAVLGSNFIQDNWGGPLADGIVVQGTVGGSGTDFVFKYVNATTLVVTDITPSTPPSGTFYGFGGGAVAGSIVTVFLAKSLGLQTTWTGEAYHTPNPLSGVLTLDQSNPRFFLGNPNEQHVTYNPDTLSRWYVVGTEKIDDLAIYGNGIETAPFWKTDNSGAAPWTMITPPAAAAPGFPANTYRWTSLWWIR